jgi:hypothetical protein
MKLGVIQFAGAASVLPEDVVDLSEGLFEHEVAAPKPGINPRARLV